MKIIRYLSPIFLGIGIAFVLYGLYQVIKLFYLVGFLIFNSIESLHYLFLAFGFFALGDVFIDIASKLIKEQLP